MNVPRCRLGSGLSSGEVPNIDRLSFYELLAEHDRVWMDKTVPLADRVQRCQEIVRLMAQPVARSLDRALAGAAKTVANLNETQRRKT